MSPERTWNAFLGLVWCELKPRRLLSDFCLSCGSSETHVRHPLFEGGLCVKCKVTFDLCSILAHLEEV